MGEQPPFHCQVFHMATLARGSWQIRHCHGHRLSAFGFSVRLLFMIRLNRNNFASAVFSSRSPSREADWRTSTFGISSPRRAAAAVWLSAEAQSFTTSNRLCYCPIFFERPPFHSFLGATLIKESLSSSTISHHGEKRPMVLLSSSISPKQTGVFRRAGRAPRGRLRVV
jgi:hypothetical protein